VDDDTRVRWAWLDSLVVNAKGGHSDTCVVHMCHVVRLFPLQGDY
jgi:hypothetical protein